MKYGIYPYCFLYGNGSKGIDFHVDLALAAEDAGWDGFFIWDHVWACWEDKMAVADPWMVMAAVAAKTEDIKIGPMVTPLARRRPSKLARETVSLDHLSNGRLIMGVGLGDTRELGHFGDASSPKVRGKMLDEGLEVLTGLWSGEPFSFEGEYYQQKEVTFLPKPVQKKIPIWVAGYWPYKAPFKRAARYDGVFPLADSEEGITIEGLNESISIIEKERGNLKNYDIVVSGDTTSIDRKADSEKLQLCANTGMTWWLEYLIDWGKKTPKDLMERVRRGPPEI
ncbi:MAG: LLM class flavin-dependent oxidoreductase [Candidatus Thorarchaeota archaeon]